MKPHDPSRLAPSPWPHRWAWVLACATYALVWVGGLVTTTHSGMAFRDWLTSDGYFMFIYPWFQAAGEKFIEHGHRLLGATVGFLAIGLVLVISRTEPRRWVRRLSWAILAGVVLQGLLGGMRVVFAVDHDNMARALALVHGCTGPLFFALCVAMVVFTAPPWHQLGREAEDQNAGGQRAAGQGKEKTATFQLRKIFYVALVTCGLAYGQLVLGAVVRHAPHMTGDLAAVAFQSALYFHLLVAALLWFNAGLLLWRSRKARHQIHDPDLLGQGLWGPICLVAFVMVQIGLGATTWWMKYGLPAWVTSLVGPLNYLNRASDVVSIVIITSHVAVGALLAVIALSITLLAARRLWSLRPGNPLPPWNLSLHRLVEVAL